MSRKLSHQPLPDRFNHLLNVISSQRFLEMKGLNNDLPFYVCEYRPVEAIDMERMRRQLASNLAGALGAVALNHPHCAKFCVLGGASCSA